jgi:hypothetical protein
MSSLDLWILEEAEGFRFLWARHAFRGAANPDGGAPARFSSARCRLDAALSAEIAGLADLAAARMDRLGRESTAANDGPLQRLGALIHQRVFPAALQAELEALPSCSESRAGRASA